MDSALSLMELTVKDPDQGKADAPGTVAAYTSVQITETCNVNEPWVEAANQSTGNNAGSEDKDSKSDYDPLKNFRSYGIPTQVMYRALVSLVPLFICLFLLPYMHSYLLVSRLPTPGQIEGIAKCTGNPYFDKVDTAGSKFSSLTTRTEALLKKLQAVKSSTKNWECLLETIDKDVASIGEVINSTDTVEEVMDLLNLFQIINTAHNVEANIEMLQQSLVGMHEAVALAKSVATEAYTEKKIAMHKNMGVPELQLSYNAYRRGNRESSEEDSVEEALLKQPIKMKQKKRRFRGRSDSIITNTPKKTTSAKKTKSNGGLPPPVVVIPKDTKSSSGPSDQYQKLIQADGGITSGSNAGKKKIVTSNKEIIRTKKAAVKPKTSQGQSSSTVSKKKQKIAEKSRRTSRESDEDEAGEEGYLSPS